MNKPVPPLPLHLRINSVIAAYLLAGLSGLLMGLCFLYPRLYPLAWVALVPLLISLQNTSVRRGYFLGVCHGLVFFSVGSYWIAHFVVALKGFGSLQAWFVAALYWFFCAQMTGILAAVLRWTHLRSNLPYVLTLPLLGTVVYDLFPFIFPVDLGLTQSEFLLALQGLDVTGILGLNAIVLIANALFYELYHWPICRRRFLSIAAVVLAGWLLYGFFALQRWHKIESNWPTLAVGIVQTNAPASIPQPPPTEGYSYAYPPEMAFFENLAESGADLVIWPETRFKGYHKFSHVRASFKDYARHHETALLLQDLDDHSHKGSYNTVTLVEPSGDTQNYSKRMLIPFAEYVPPLLMFSVRPTQWLFGEFYSPLKKGIQHIMLEYDDHRWTPLICYEVAFSKFVSESIQASDTRAQFITVQSNDVWFGATRQPSLHLAVSILRSVENRLPLVHVINNGPSAVLSSTGRVLFQLPEREQGAYLLQIPKALQAEPTFFNQNTRLIASVLRALALLVLFWVFLNARSRRHRPAR